MLGYTLTPDSMVSFQQAVFPLLIGSFLIIAGNTGFPCFLRLIIWILYKIYPENSARRETFAFLLDHPRRCFTLLFPSSATWWLFGVLVILNVLDLFFFLVLDLGDDYVTRIPVGYRILDGFFQVPIHPRELRLCGMWCVLGRGLMCVCRRCRLERRDLQ